MKDFATNSALALIAVLAPAQGMILTAFLLVTVDLITGVIAAHKRGEKITSARLRDSVTKAVVFEICIILGFLTEIHLTGPDLPVSKWVAGLIGLAEMRSCVENLNSISGGNLLKSLLDKLGSANK